MNAFGHQKIVFCNDPATGLKAIIAIHDTTLGPALGGTRMWSYKTEADALNDVLRLSKSMTYKAAVAGLNLRRKIKKILPVPVYTIRRPHTVGVRINPVYLVLAYNYTMIRPVCKIR